jgi:hypothetical protein
MTLNLTNWEYYTLKLSYPDIDTSTLVKISSRIKTPNVCEVMDLNDYQIYQTQQFENKKIIDEILKSRGRDSDSDIDVVSTLNELVRTLNNNRKTQLKFSSYYLLPGHDFWKTLEPV